MTWFNLSKNKGTNRQHQSVVEPPQPPPWMSTDVVSGIHTHIYIYIYIICKHHHNPLGIPHFIANLPTISSLGTEIRPRNGPAFPVTEQMQCSGVQQHGFAPNVQQAWTRHRLVANWWNTTVNPLKPLGFKSKTPGFAWDCPDRFPKWWLNNFEHIYIMYTYIHMMYIWLSFCHPAMYHAFTQSAFHQ